MDENRSHTPPPVLTAPERHALRSQAHRLDPVVLIGDAGFTDAVALEIDRALSTHELIKIRIAGDDRDARTQLRETLPDRLGCAIVQAIGKTLVLWRPQAGDKREPVLAEDKPRQIRRKLLTLPKKAAGSGKKPELRPRKPRREPPQQVEEVSTRGGRAPNPGRSSGRGPTGLGAPAARRSPVPAGTGRPASGASGPRSSVTGRGGSGLGGSGRSGSAASGSGSSARRTGAGVAGSGGLATKRGAGAAGSGGFGSRSGAGAAGSGGFGSRSGSGAARGGGFGSRSGAGTAGSGGFGGGSTGSGTPRSGFRKKPASVVGQVPARSRPPASGARRAPATRAAASPAGSRPAAPRSRAGGGARGGKGR